MKKLQINQVIQELDSSEKPYAIVYNPSVNGLENRVKSKWDDGKCREVRSRIAPGVAVTRNYSNTRGVSDFSEVKV